MEWSEIGSLDADGCVVRVSAATAEGRETGRVGISFASTNMTSYIEVDPAQLEDVIQLLSDASRHVTAKSYQLVSED